jgi:hypothetical protein
VLGRTRSIPTYRYVRGHQLIEHDSALLCAAHDGRLEEWVGGIHTTVSYHGAPLAFGLWHDEGAPPALGCRSCGANAEHMSFRVSVSDPRVPHEPTSSVRAVWLERRAGVCA